MSVAHVYDDLEESLGIKKKLLLTKSRENSELQKSLDLMRSLSFA